MSEFENTVFVTGNDNKLREFNQITGLNLTRIDADVHEIQSLYADEVARHKVVAAAKIAGGPVIVEDVGLEIHNRFPGALIKFMLETHDLATIAKMYPNSEARAVCAYAYYHPKSKKGYVWKVSVPGTIVDPRGKKFGFDPIFCPRGSAMTYAEMESSEKNKVSHRALALRKMMKGFGADADLSFCEK